MNSPLPAASARKNRSPIPAAASLSQRIVAWIAAHALRLLAGTLRYRVHGGCGTKNFPDEPVIFVLWHNRLCLCMRVYEHLVKPHHSHGRLAALVSASKDGALLASVLQNFGVEPVRGSSSRRGARAMRELIAWAEKGYHLAVTPDGPRGPCYSMGDGVIALAQATGMPIVPYSCRLGWKLRVKSWDRFEIPLPFSKCEMAFGAPIRVPRDVSGPERDQYREQLREVLLRGLTREPETRGESSGYIDSECHGRLVGTSLLRVGAKSESAENPIQ